MSQPRFVPSESNAEPHDRKSTTNFNSMASRHFYTSRMFHFLAPDQPVRYNLFVPMVLDEIQERGIGPLILHTVPEWDTDGEQFYRFCQANPDLRIERTSEGDLVIMPPAGGSSGHGNIKLAFFFERWASQDGTGRAFDSSTGFKLPNRAVRSPDISWVRNERLDTLTDADWKKFLPLCPDFVLELRSPSDPLRMIQEKMEEYLANGALLGWLLDPLEKRLHIYRPNAPAEILDHPAKVSGDPVLKNFQLDIPLIWAAIERNPR